MVQMTRLPAVITALVLLGGALLHVQDVQSTNSGQTAPGNEHFQRRWARTDQPVAGGAVARTWVWGPEANTEVLQEQYSESPGGQRQVQYFDKSRMEIVDPSGDPSTPFYVTNGLLVIELMSGRMQVGNDAFEQHAPAQVNVAGDPDDPLTYADLAPLRAAAPLADGSVITQTLDGNGTVGEDAALASHAVTAAYRLSVPGVEHQVASPFWTFLNATGPVVLDGQMVTERLFEPWFYATGYPVTEAYWAQVKVAGTVRLVLLQCFERRCLTYTPGNPEGFLVEAGNVGQHYWTWRYVLVPGEGTPTATASETSTSTVTATSTTATGTPTSMPTTTSTATPTSTATATATTAPEPATTYAFVREWGEMYAPITPLRFPAGMAVDAENNLWVADSNNHRLVQFDENGVYLRSLGAMGTGPGEFQHPTGIAVSEDGKLYVVDRYNYRIQVFNADGQYLFAWGSEGTGTGQFHSAHAIGILGETVYVVDSGNHRVQLFDLDGTFVIQFGALGTNSGQFDTPLGIAFDLQGNVYVSDYGNHRIQKFNGYGGYLSQFGSEGTDPGQFAFPEGIVVDAEGYTYVADKENDRVQVFTPEGIYHYAVGEAGDEFGELNGPRGLALDHDGNLYVADGLNGRVQKFTAGGAFLFDVWDSRRGTFSVPTDIVFDESGALLVIDGHDDIPTITKYNLDGIPLETFGRTRTGLGQYDRLRGVAVSSLGLIYVTDRITNRVQCFSATWVYCGQWGTTGTLPAQFNNPTAIATDLDGNFYVVDTGNNRIQKFDNSGVFLDEWGSAGSGNGQFKGPEGIAIDGERVYVTDYGNDRVQVFTRDGEYIEQWGGAGSALGQLESPAGVEVRPDGYVLVVDFGNNRVVVYTPEGEAVDEFGSAGSGPGQFNVPWGIAVDDDGNVYVTDINNHRVQKFAPVS